MFVLLSLGLLAMTLASLLLALTALLPLKSPKDAEKLSPFECGFSPFESSWQSFSIQFFLVSLVFLIFDVELILMFPVMMAWLKSSSVIPIALFWGFMVILSLGYGVEWVSAQLEWFSFQGS